MAFSRTPPKPSTAEEFIAAADAPPAPVPTTPAPVPIAPAPTMASDHVVAPKAVRRRSAPHQSGADKPWEQFPRKARSRKIFNLRFNDYYWAVLNHIKAKRQSVDGEEISLHTICQELLFNALEHEAGIEPKGVGRSLSEPGPGT